MKTVIISATIGLVGMFSMATMSFASPPVIEINPDFGLMPINHTCNSYGSYLNCIPNP